MYTKPNAHGIYQYVETGTFFCMATKREAFEQEGGDMAGATPIALMPYTKAAGMQLHPDPEYDRISIQLISDGARSIVENANKLGFEPDGVANAVQFKLRSINSAIAKKRSKAREQQGAKKATKRRPRVSA